MTNFELIKEAVGMASLATKGKALLGQGVSKFKSLAPTTKAAIGGGVAGVGAAKLLEKNSSLKGKLLKLFGKEVPMKKSLTGMESGKRFLNKKKPKITTIIGGSIWDDAQKMNREFDLKNKKR